MPQKTIEAVVEIRPYGANPPWPIAAIPDPSFLRLFSGVTDEEIGMLILTACSYNQIDVHSSPIETLNAFVAEDFVLPGGLRFSEAGEVKIVPGCCCGLEEWRDWLDVPNGETVWAGHNPQPGVEFTDGIIRVWRDEKDEGVEFINFGVDEMRNLLKEVESDLNGFLFRLGEWTDSVAPELKAAVVEHFAKNTDIIENPNRTDTARFFELVLAEFPELKENSQKTKACFIYK